MVSRSKSEGKKIQIDKMLVPSVIGTYLDVKFASNALILEPTTWAGTATEPIWFRSIET